MISSRQIKAARALLDWTQGDLAEAAGLHLNAVNRIEQTLAKPRAMTLHTIQSALESAGIRFRGQRGVELKDDIFEIKRHEGPTFISALIEDSFSVLHGPSDELLTLTPDERLFNMTDHAASDRYYRQMKKIGFRERCITGQTYDLFVNNDREAYRWLPQEVLGVLTYVTYGNRTAFIHWQVQESLIIRNASLAATFRSQFEFLWARARRFTQDSSANGDA